MVDKIKFAKLLIRFFIFECKSINPFVMVSFVTKTGQFLGEIFLKAS